MKLICVMKILFLGNLSFVENERNWLGKTPETLSFYRFFTDTLYHPCSFIKKTAFDTFGGMMKNIKFVQIGNGSFGNL